MRTPSSQFELFGKQTIVVCGKSFVADDSGALYWPAEDTLVVADLHLEKASRFARQGSLLPPYDTRQTLVRLAEAIDRYAPARVISLGDSLHDPGAADRMADADLQAVAIMQEGREWIWVTGNHDPHIPAPLGGAVTESVSLGGLRFVHAPYNGPVTHEIAGHLHPAARLSVHGYAIRKPCFVSNGLRLVLPAFGTFTGGLNVLDEAFGPVFGQDGIQVCLLGQEGVYPVAARQLRAD
jgi:hypothetical protein